VDYISYSHSIHNDVLWGKKMTNFHEDLDQQKALLTLLYNKLAIEHRRSYGGLFLSFDRDRNGMVSMEEFQEAMARLGVPLSKQHILWLMEKFDCDQDGRIAYKDFLNMLTAWRRNELTDRCLPSPTGSLQSPTALQGDFDIEKGSPFKTLSEGVSRHLECLCVPIRL